MICNMARFLLMADPQQTRERSFYARHAMRSLVNWRVTDRGCETNRLVHISRASPGQQYPGNHPASPAPASRHMLRACVRASPVRHLLVSESGPRGRRSILMQIFSFSLTLNLRSPSQFKVVHQVFVYS